MLPLLLACAAPDRWPAADAACADFSAGCHAVLAEDFGLSDALTGLPQVALLEGLWTMVGLSLGEDCPDWAPDGEHAAACLYNAAADAVDQSVLANEGYLTLADGVLQVGPAMGYYSPVRVPVALAGALGGSCGVQWLGDAGLTGCEGEDCFIFVEAAAAECTE